MTVSELIEVLRGMDQDLEVTVWDPQCFNQTDSIDSVELLNGEVVIF